ncbi:hypothetical protein BKA70DRAFT_1302924 [Coprinopsis sp. MPI-PUGE-AT-0042]|nr:hypothetical protein BKA70DRAFT_1302924 [Coprinopsis sp. MPI-PUGE-AT-0042]
MLYSTDQHRCWLLVGAGKQLSCSSGGTPRFRSYGLRGEVFVCIVKFLLVHRGIQVNLIDNGESSALVKAALWGHKGVAKLLLVQSEIQVNLFVNNGWSALGTHAG